MDSVRELLTEDHSRLDVLLEDARNCDSAEELASYDKFRRGLLKHIGIEEKILLPAAARLRGAALEQAPRLRLDHGALVALLMPIPTAAIVRALKSVLAAHNPIEEGADGVYQICQTLAAAETDELVRKIRAAPEVPTTPNTTSTRIIDAAKRALVRAGYDPTLMDS
jgi:hypothetical protein